MPILGLRRAVLVLNVDILDADDELGEQDLSNLGHDARGERIEVEVGLLGLGACAGWFCLVFTRILLRAAVGVVSAVEGAVCLGGLFPARLERPGEEVHLEIGQQGLLLGLGSPLCQLTLPLALPPLPEDDLDSAHFEHDFAVEEVHPGNLELEVADLAALDGDGQVQPGDVLQRPAPQLHLGHADAIAKGELEALLRDVNELPYGLRQQVLQPPLSPPEHLSGLGPLPAAPRFASRSLYRAREGRVVLAMVRSLGLGSEGRSSRQGLPSRRVAAPRGVI